MATWIDLFTATAPWAAILATIVIYLHTRRAGAIETLNKKIDEYAKGDALAHEAMRVQINDIQRTASSVYVRREEMNEDFRTLNENLTRVGKEVGSVANRVDELYKSVQWRHGED